MTVAQWITLHVRVWGRFPTLRSTVWRFEGVVPKSRIWEVWRTMELKQKAGKNV